MSSFMSKKTGSPKVVVVGAGIAGLTTAYRLQQQGIDVELYEARPRVGGRILTVRVNDQIGELGAQSICDGGKAECLCRLIEELGLEIQSGTMPLDHAYFDGKKLIPSCELISQFDPEALKNKLNFIRQSSENMLEVLSALFDSKEPIFKLLATRLACYEGAPPDQLSSRYTETLYHMLLGGASAAHQENTITLASVKGGNSILPEKLAQVLGNRIHLNAPLISVSKTSKGLYTLLFQNGKTTNAEILVLAMPCSVYSDILFEETVIPPQRLAAIQSIRCGTNAKILVPFPEIPQRTTILVNDQMGSFFSANGRLLTCYYRGENSRFSAATIDDTFNRNRSMLEIGYAYSSLSLPIIACDRSFVQYRDPVGYSWPNDPYAKGSYSYIGPGQDTLLTTVHEIEGEIVKTLFAPIDRTLYFVGEHTSILQEVPGTLEAACESGERTARMVIRK